MAQEPTPYTREQLVKAKQAMLDQLAEFSGGELIRGCCTQGCCDPTAQDFVVSLGNLEPTIKTYTKEHIERAKRAMLLELTEISGGVIIAGCCTQGCCDPVAQSSWIVFPADR